MDSGVRATRLTSVDLLGHTDCHLLRWDTHGSGRRGLFCARSLRGLASVGSQVVFQKGGDEEGHAALIRLPLHQLLQWYTEHRQK